MKKISLALIVVIMSLSLNSCQLIGDIFKAGVWAGILFVVAILAVVIFLLSKIFSKK